MKKLKLLSFSFIFCLIALCSCQKEISYEVPETIDNPSLLGEWNLSYMEVETLSDIIMTDGTDALRSVTTSHYFTKNNKGRVKIEPAKMSVSDMSYSIDTVMYMKYYENGTLVDEMEMDFMVDMPPASSVVNYKLVGADSIYFPGGGMVTMDPGSTGMPTIASGAKYKIEGDKLTMVTSFTLVNEATQSGIKTTNKASGKQTIILQKQ